MAQQNEILWKTVLLTQSGDFTLWLNEMLLRKIGNERVELDSSQ